MAERNAERHAQRYIGDAPSVRRAPLTFGLGAMVAVGVPFGLPLLMSSPVAGVGLFATSWLVGTVIGYGASKTFPYRLLGKEEQYRLADELDALARAALVTDVAAPPDAFDGPRETWIGELVGTPTPGPFSSEPILAAHVVGRHGVLTVDDAWVAPGPLAIRPAPEEATGEETTKDQAPVRLEVALDSARGLWLCSEQAKRSALGELDRELEMFFAARGAHPDVGRRASDASSLHVAVFRAGDRVRVTGRPSSRSLSDGYRGTREALVLEPPHVVEHVR